MTRNKQKGKKMPANLKAEEFNYPVKLFEIERIVGKRQRFGHTEYLVKWVGFGSDENTWEPPAHLTAVPALIELFEKSGPNAPITIGPGPTIQQTTHTNPTKKSSPPKVHPPQPQKKYKGGKPRIISGPSEEEKVAIPEEGSLGGNNTSKGGCMVTLGGGKGRVVPEESKGEDALMLPGKRKSVERFGKAGVVRNSTSGDGRKKLRQSSTHANYAEKQHKILEEETPRIVGPITEVKSAGLMSFGEEPVHGTFEFDTPRCVSKAKLVGKTVICTVEWQVRKNGAKPEPTRYPNSILRDKCPMLLLEFYESRVRFHPEPKTGLAK